MPVHVVVDVLEDLLEFLGNPRHVRGDLGVAVSPDAERLGCGGHLVRHLGRTASQQAKPGNEEQEQGESVGVSRHRNLLLESDGGQAAPLFSRNGQTLEDMPGGSDLSKGEERRGARHFCDAERKAWRISSSLAYYQYVSPHGSTP